MRRDSRLSGVLHVLLHLAQRGAPMTSAQLAQAMSTNAVVIRRVLGGLRDRGYVRAVKGHGGGWEIARDLATISLLDVYVALGEPGLIAIGNRSESPSCLVEQAVNTALGQTFADAEALVRARLGEITLAQLADEFRQRYPHAQHVHGRSIR